MEMYIVGIVSYWITFLNQLFLSIIEILKQSKMENYTSNIGSEDFCLSSMTIITIFTQIK